MKESHDEIVIKTEPGRPVVQIGKFGDIKRLMKFLSKKDSNQDLYMICKDGTLSCHKFIIGAQSRYLKQLIINSTQQGDTCKILFPDVSKSHMEVILKFLYTGKLGITHGIKHIVKELLEDVLHVDAKVTIPDTIPTPSSKRDRSPDDKGGSGGSRRPSQENGGPPVSERKADAPPKTNGGPSDQKNQMSSAANNGSRENKTALRKSLVLSFSGDERPLTPPHDVEICDYDDDDIEVLPTPSKPAPEMIDIDIEDDRATGAGSVFGDKAIFQAPSIISKRTGGPPSQLLPPHPKQAIFPAPRMVAKSTGYHPPRTTPKIIQRPTIDISGVFPQLVNTDIPLRLSPDQTVTIKKRQEGRHPSENMPPEKRQKIEQAYMNPASFVTPVSAHVSSAVPNTYIPHPKLPLPMSMLPPPPPTTTSASLSRQTRTRTGALSRTNLNEDRLEYETGLYDYLMDDIPGMDDMKHDPDFSLPLPPLHTLPLPLPVHLPQPPEPGMVIHRGKWVHESSLPTKSHGNSKGLHKYHYMPYTITGRMKSATMASIEEPDGRWECDQCENVYSKRVSLIKHMGRIHNPRSNVQCPECPKMLSHKGAVAKHLLSHRPEESWPYQCEFCGKFFQAKGDLPKHWFTQRHRGDPNIPAPGSAQWIEVLNRSVRYNLKQVFVANGGTLPLNFVGNTPFMPPPNLDDATREENNYDDEDEDLILDGSMTDSNNKGSKDCAVDTKTLDLVDTKESADDPLKDPKESVADLHKESNGQATKTESELKNDSYTESKTAKHAKAIDDVTDVTQPVPPTPFGILDILDELGQLSKP